MNDLTGQDEYWTLQGDVIWGSGMGGTAIRAISLSDEDDQYVLSASIEAELTTKISVIYTYDDVIAPPPPDPVPVPATILLLGTGLVFLAGAGRKKA